MYLIITSAIHGNIYIVNKILVNHVYANGKFMLYKLNFTTKLTTTTTNKIKLKTCIWCICKKLFEEPLTRIAKCSCITNT